MQITNEYMRQWNLETEELYEMAMRSAVRLLPAEFCSLPDMIRRITGIEVEAIRGMQRECQMYVLTNSSKIQGAACMFYPHVLEMIGEILKEDFYILPSSIHEVIILPKSREIAKEELDAMIQDIKDNRVTFGSKLGVILATVGCAVGLGSIWRFPYMLGTNGGAAFLLIYILFMIFLGIPVMVTEFFIGRYSRSNTVGSFKKMAPGTKWCWIGYNGILAAFLILGFYAVVSGWTLEYVWQTVNGSLYSTPGVDFTAGFDNFSSNALRPIFWTAVFIGLTHFVIASGVEKGIERASKIMMPLLFFILVVMCVRSVTLPNAEAGLVYLFKPDFSKLTSSVVLSAVGQAFFSLSLGMGCLITYSSYFGKDTNMLATAWQVTIINTFVAVLAGIMIFPAVFSFGIAPSAGAQLVFITLPNVFEQLPFSSLWSLIFYILLAMAALTSTISLHEVVTAYIHEEFRMTRKRAAWLVSIGVFILGILSSLSFGLLKEFTIGGLIFFDALDYLTAKIMLPLGGMLTCIFVGTRVDKKILKAELTNEGTIKFRLFSIYVFFMKYVSPIAIGIVFLNELGLLDQLKKIF